MHKSYINIVMKMFFLDSEHIEMWGNAPNPQINHLYPTYLFTITISPSRTCFPPLSNRVGENKFKWEESISPAQIPSNDIPEMAK